MSTARATKRREAKAAANGYLQVLNADIFHAIDPLKKLMAKELPVRTSFALAKLANTLNGHLQAIEVVRNGLVRKYGKPMEDRPGGLQVALDSVEYPKFIEEMNELLSEKADVAAQKVILPVTLDGMGIEASVLMPLLAFIDIAEDAPVATN